MKKHIGMIVIGASIVAILVLYWITFTVRWKEQALVVRFGEIKRMETEPGLKWKWPWEREVKFDGRIRTLVQIAKQTRTHDKQTIIATIYVNWRIKNPKLFYERFRIGGTGSEDVVYKARKAIEGWVDDAMNVIAEYNLEELITLDEARFKLHELEKDPQNGMLGRVREFAAAKEGYGIEIVDLGLRQLGVPDSVSQAVFERMRQDRDAVRDTLLAEGQSQAESIKGQAESQAAKIIAEAQARAKQIQAQGDAEAAQYYAAFLEHTDLANFLRRLDTLRTTLNDRATIVLDGKAPPYDMLSQAPHIVDKVINGKQSKN